MPTLKGNAKWDAITVYFIITFPFLSINLKPIRRTQTKNRLHTTDNSIDAKIDDYYSQLIIVIIGRKKFHLR